MQPVLPLLAYASAYIQCHYLAAFTAALLNNQPMGFYQPFTIIKDAQRHGLEVKPIDITCSEWLCTLEEMVAEKGRKGDGGTQRHGDIEACSPSPHLPVSPSPLALRLGLKYVKGLRAERGSDCARTFKVVRRMMIYAIALVNCAKTNCENWRL